MNKLKERKVQRGMVSLVLAVALLIAVAYPGLKTVAEELAENNGGGYTSSEDNVSEAVLEVYENGRIKLRSFEDLQKVGTGAALTTADGMQVYDISGYAVTYALDANYMVVEDIVLPAGKKWVLPKNFTGSIAPEDADTDEDADQDAPNTKADVEKAIADTEKDAKDHPLYNKDNNTINIYNPYQLVTLQQADAADQPVMSLDFCVATYGMGQLVFGDSPASSTTSDEASGADNSDADASAAGYLTYDPENTYVVSTQFNSATPELLSEKLKALTLEEDSAGEDATPADMSAVKAKLAAPRKANSSDAANYDAYGIPIDGRDYGGQVVMEIGGTNYILLGDKKQLKALDLYDDWTKEGLVTTREDAPINGPIYKVTLKVTKAQFGVDEYGIDDSKEIRLVYPGDADLIAGVTVYDTQTDATYDASELTLGYVFEKGKKKSINGDLILKTDGLDGDLLSGKSPVIYAALDDNGIIDITKRYGKDSNESHEFTSLTYKPDLNYIVFRDIDFDATGGEDTADDLWTPLTFYGNMYGIRESGTGVISTLNVEDFVDHPQPTISNITVNQTGSLDLNQYIGVGFFATIKERESVASKSLVNYPVHVENIRLENVNITNESTAMKESNTLLNALTELLGSLVGTVLDGLVKLLQLNLSQDSPGFNNALKNLLDARQTSPTNFATGAFAGRIEGDVTIKNCEVSKVSVTSEEKGYVGGFVGYASGEATYDVLSGALETVVDGLATILNAIPFIGLGDLVTILLKNVVDSGKLIPTGYKSPTIIGSEVNQLTGTLGSTEKGSDFNGGFIGYQSGTRIESSTITDSTVDVRANTYGGGFTGLARNGELEGLLNQLGVELISIIHPESVLLDSGIYKSSVNVSGDKYLGGFVGELAESYSVNCTMNLEKPLTVEATDSWAGGFCGYATLGWVTTAGDAQGESSLVSVLSRLLNQLLTDGANAGDMLLSLAGVAPSAVMGCQMTSSAINISAKKNYAGGILGEANGVYLTPSSKEYLNEIPLWSTKEVTEGKGETRKAVTLTPLYELAEDYEGRQNLVKGLESVTAGGNFAGGIAGALYTASISGLLNNTLGVGDFIGFKADDIHITGIDNGFKVLTGDSYAGGGIGEAVGGFIKNTTVSNLASVIARENYAGGFVGRSGPGALASGGGLTVNLLGLNNVLKVDNLLAIGNAVHTKVFDTTVTGIPDGFVVESQGAPADVGEVVAGGFIAQANSMEISNAHVVNLNYVKANDKTGVTGGFVGRSTTGDLADVGDAKAIDELIKVDGLLNAVSYLIPDYKFCDVTYVSNTPEQHTKGFVQSAVAGGFAGDFQSGFVNRWHDGLLDSEETKEANKAAREKAAKTPWAVYNIDHVSGQYYGGGFGGKVYSGALATTGKGISILGGSGLNINIGDLVSLVEAYVPIINYAGVNSEEGFVVSAAALNPKESTSGAAGGYIGYASGAEISHSDVKYLRHVYVENPQDLEVYEAPSYFDERQSGYSVTGGRYAGGYVGLANIGSAASVGKSLGALGSTLALNDALSALNAVVTTIEHSNVYGGMGGFDILANQKDDTGLLGEAGGFAGAMKGAHIQDSNSYLFIYIVGRESAGGYVGTMEPGSIAEAIGSLSLLGDLVKVPSDLLSVGKDFVPTIRNSETTCVPCGGAVRAEALSDTRFRRGMAGGYCGHNEGGQIWGWNDDAWRDENKKEQREDDHIEHSYYTGPQRECAAVRILSVYGTEFAGGFTGKMEAASTAEGGSLELLGGLLSADNLLGALKAAYPTEENTAVYGPLYHMDYELWDKWMPYVAQYGGYGQELLELYNSKKVTDQASLNHEIANYEYGYNTVAGRKNYQSGTIVSEGGVAGGYVGQMQSGVVTNGQAYNAKKVEAMKAAGGFAGEALVGGLAEVGSISLFKDSPLELNLNIGGLLSSIVDVFVPVIKNSSVRGYRAGLRVIAKGAGTENNLMHNLSNAGGYIGNGAGVQIWGDAESSKNVQNGCNVKNLLEVRGNRTAGGYAGNLISGSTLNVDTNEASDGGLINGLLTSVIDTPSSLASVLDATVSTVRNAHVKALNGEWGYTVEGVQEKKTDPEYAMFAGGFVGNSEATIFGDKDLKDTAVSVSAEGLRGVNGGEYAGGFFGLADINGVANVAENKTKIVGLINAGGVSVIDAFKTYVYSGKIVGIPEGYVVKANTATKTGIMDTTRFTGCAGGFGGGLMNGTVTYSTADNLNAVTGLNYNGGFIGHMGKSGIVNVDDAELGTDKTPGGTNTLSSLLGANVGVLNIFGAHTEHCSVTGIEAGYTVSSHEGKEPIAAGFAAYADLSRILDCEANNLKYVSSDGIAGGFVGVTTMAYLASVEVNGKITKLVVDLVNTLLKILQANKLENLDLVDIGNKNQDSLLGLKLLADGDLLYVNLLGLKIGVSLDKPDPDGGKTNAAIVTIGDSSIRLPVSDNGEIENLDNQNIEINLIKGNRTKVVNSKVTGVKDGYDVYGGGATYDTDGTKQPVSGAYTRGGYAGGFVGNNHEGKIQGCEMILCDVVRGTANYIGPFSGASSINSVYSFNDLDSIEGLDEGVWNVYHVYRGEEDNSINHMEFYKTYSDWEGDSLQVYRSPAKAVLMDDTPLSANVDSTTGKPTDVMDPCIEYVDITLTKKWMSDSFFGQTSTSRPDSITLHLIQTLVTQDGTVVDKDGFPKEIVTEADVERTRTGETSELPSNTGTGIQMTNEDRQSWLTPSVWQIKMDGLPASYMEGDTTYYYTYTLKEDPVAGYETEITPDKAGYNKADNKTVYEFTITNTLLPGEPLPSTGGRGMAIFILAGMLIVALGLTVKSKKEALDEENGGEPGA